MNIQPFISGSVPRVGTSALTSGWLAQSAQFFNCAGRAWPAPNVSNMPTLADELVSLVPLVDGGYARNFIRQAVCELKFPTLMSISAAKPPEKFVSALRKRFPIYETVNEVSIGGGQGSVTAHAHVVRSSKLTWTATIRQSSIVLETSAYGRYADFKERLSEVIAAALPVIDCDFFTRVGLRYVNVIETDGSSMSEWVNPALVGSLDVNAFKGFSEFAGKFTLGAVDGGCMLQHGIRINQESQTSGPVPIRPDYVVDIDSFRVEVAADEVLGKIDSMHHQVFSMFSWALGEKAKLALASPK